MTSSNSETFLIIDDTMLVRSRWRWWWSRSGKYQVGEITWPRHVTGVPTPQFSSYQALNSYAIFQGVGKSHFTKNQGRGSFFSWRYLKRTFRSIQILNVFFDAPAVLCPSFGSMERLKLWRFIYGAHKQINGVLKARSQCWLTLIANDDARLHLSIASRIRRKTRRIK